MWSAFISLLLASPSYAIVLESLRALPHGWQESKQAVSDDTTITLHVALQYQNIDKLESELASVSTPGSPRYGQYQDIDTQSSIFAPSNASAKVVTDWLAQQNTTAVKRSEHGLVSFSTTVRKANEILNTEFKYYTNGAATKLRTRSYSVPDHLVDHIDLISPTTYFGDLKAQMPVTEPEAPSSTTKEPPTKRQAQVCSQTTITTASGRHIIAFTPECIRELYNTTEYTPDASSGSTTSFANFLGESPNHADLALFESKYNIPKQDFETLALINGAVDDQDPLTAVDGEANLDVQYITAVAQGLPVYSYITGGVAPFYPDLLEQNASQASNEPYLQFYDYLLSQPNSKLPYVISQSYADHENTVPPKYATRVCNQIGMLGLRGRTVLGGTGDEGVGAVCRDNRPEGNLHGKPQFTPFFPASCPYMTAVGGTQFQYPEEAWNATGGGFSFYFKTAWYQKNAVNEYLSEHITPATKNYYSSNDYVDFGGRGLPDISAHSIYPWYAIVENSTVVPSGGTSAATPVVAAIVALLNDARLRAGKPVMGFINPWLYSAGYKSLNDITLGSAVGCNGYDLQYITNPLKIDGAGVIPYASWNATPGWDPATGLGTPDFIKLKDTALDSCDWPSVPGTVWKWPPFGGWGWKNGKKGHGW